MIFDSLTHSTDILKDILDNVANGTVRPNIVKKLSLENAVEYLNSFKRHQIGKAVVIFP